MLGLWEDLIEWFTLIRDEEEDVIIPLKIAGIDNDNNNDSNNNNKNDKKHKKNKHSNKNSKDNIDLNVLKMTEMKSNDLLNIFCEYFKRLGNDRQQQGFWATLGFGQKSQYSPKFRLFCKSIAFFLEINVLNVPSWFHNRVNSTLFFCFVYCV